MKLVQVLLDVIESCASLRTHHSFELHLSCLLGPSVEELGEVEFGISQLSPKFYNILTYVIIGIAF